MVAGIIVVAAANDEVLAHPSVAGDAAITWLVLGGPALFLAGHALFKFVIWGVMPWSRLAAILVLALLWLLVPHVHALALGSCAAGVVVAVAVSDRLLSYGSAADEAGAREEAHG
jgi:low temperature requirement protein LtrA